MKTLIHTTPNATVTISKGLTVKTEQADSNGDVTFSVTVGTWNVKCEANGGEITGQIVVTDTFELDLPVGQKLVNMALNTKIKLGTYSNAPITWYLINRNLSGFPDGAQSIVTEYAVGGTVNANPNYDISATKTVATTAYNSLTEREKSFVLVTPKNIYNGTSVTAYNEHFYVPTSVEMGLASSGYKGTTGANLGFNTQASRILKTSSGSAVTQWMSEAFDHGLINVIWSDGQSNRREPNNSFNVRLFANLSPGTLLSPNPDSEGYYTIL